MSDIKILICYHKPAPCIKSEVFAPVHVGKALAAPELKEELAFCIGDDTGDNISRKNRSYCELTALYWAWKNLPSHVEHVGLMHYRRFLDFKRRNREVIVVPEDRFEDIGDRFGLDDERVRELCHSNDILLPRKATIHKQGVYDIHSKFNCLDGRKSHRLKDLPEYLSLYEHYTLVHREDDLRLAIRVLLEKHPHFLSSLDDSLADTTARFCNMFVMRRDWFDKYMNFLFDILFDVEGRLPRTHPVFTDAGAYDARLFGFLAERLLSFFVDQLEMSETPVRIVELPTVVVDGPTQNAQAANTPNSSASRASLPCNVSEPYEIFLASDNRYAREIGVAIASVLTHSTPEERFSFHILDGGISETNRFRIEQLKSIKDFDIEFVRIDESVFEACPITAGSHFSPATYYRFLIPRLAPNLKRVLYLDCDLLVVDSLRELWSTDISQHYAAAVEDTWTYPAEVYKYDLGMNRTEPYFNAGVMLINLQRWRDERLDVTLFKTMAELEKNGTIRYVDQDVLNYHLRGQVRVLPLRWNVQQTLYFMTSQHVVYSREEMNDARDNPAIVHFSGDRKPWHAGCIHPERDRYERYVNKTAWGSYKRPAGIVDWLERYRRLAVTPSGFLMRDFWMQTSFRRKTHEALRDPVIAATLWEFRQLRIVKLLVGALLLLVGTVTFVVLDLVKCGTLAVRLVWQFPRYAVGVGTKTLAFFRNRIEARNHVANPDRDAPRAGCVATDQVDRCQREARQASAKSREQTSSSFALSHRPGGTNEFR